MVMASHDATRETAPSDDAAFEPETTASPRASPAAETFRAQPAPASLADAANAATESVARPSFTPGPPRVDEQRTVLETIGLYLRLGFLHILPRGLDHILFVLALFLASTRLRPLLIQITTFTAAHTLTLALAASGLVTAPADLVEPLIALSIAFVAIENIFFKDMTRWRPFVVFAFGLFHGLGFASVLVELGLPRAHFATALVSFNVGVEVGQLTVVALALAPALMLRRLLARERVPHLYRPIAVIPSSIAIAVAGVVWASERAFQFWGTT